jgi:hypothetical protein
MTAVRVDQPRHRPCQPIDVPLRAEKERMRDPDERRCRRPFGDGTCGRCHRSGEARIEPPVFRGAIDRLIPGRRGRKSRGTEIREELLARREDFEIWSQIVLDALPELLVR